MSNPSEQELVEQARELSCDLRVNGVVGLGIAVVEALRLVRNAGYADPVQIAIDIVGFTFAEDFFPNSIEAAYVTEKRSIIINGQSDIFLRLGPDTRSKDVRKGMWGPMSVSGHPLAPILHMMGHAIHHYRSPEVYEKLMTLTKHDQPWWVEELREVPENFVSESAMKSWMHFVAEVFTAIVLGIEVSPLVMRHYRRVEGPVPLGS